LPRIATVGRGHTLRVCQQSTGNGRPRCGDRERPFPQKPTRDKRPDTPPAVPPASAAGRNPVDRGAVEVAAVLIPNREVECDRESAPNLNSRRLQECSFRGSAPVLPTPVTSVTERRLLPSTDFADDGVVHDADAWSRASSSCWRPDRHTACGRRQRTSGNAAAGGAAAPLPLLGALGRLRCGSACPRQLGSSMKGVGLVGELVTPRGQSRGRKLPSGRRHRERRGRSALGVPFNTTPG
jgi:hypothetical protein